MKTDVFFKYPRLDEDKIDALLSDEISNNNTKLIVLDDDPTGVQTVHDVLVCTNWSEKSIRKGFEHEKKLFFILTNSRGMTAQETTIVHREIAANVARVADEVGTKYLYMSRSDSTLRGHYPLETQLLKEDYEKAEDKPVDGEIICPFFKEGGRFTIDNVHYVQYGNELVPVADTEFAKDKTFGYSSSLIPDYIEEKNGERYKKENVICISLDEIRAMDFDGITKKLLSVTEFNKVCVNAIDYVDIKVVAIAIYRAMSLGKTFLFRTAASLVKVMGGISSKPLLTREEMISEETPNGGLVVVGSHTQKTTAQLNELLKLENTVAIPFNSDLVLQDDEALNKEIDRCLALEKKTILEGKTAVCFTSRNLLSFENDTKEAALQRSIKISNCVQSLVGRLTTKPSFIIAKGGITSSDIGVKALRVEYAWVIGQVCFGIPVWKTDGGSKFPNIPYVIFPGNVGEIDTLRKTVEILTDRN